MFHLKRKTQAAQIRRPGHQRPGGGFLGNRHHPGKFRVGDVVELPQELDRLQVFAAAILVGDPFALFARVIQVKHRGHGIDPQPVDVKAVAPEERVGREEIADFMPAVIENQRAPILVGAFARIFVLVQRGAIEIGQRPIVAREMRRAPNRRSRQCPPRAGR